MTTYSWPFLPSESALLKSALGMNLTPYFTRHRLWYRCRISSPDILPGTASVTDHDFSVRELDCESSLSLGAYLFIANRITPATTTKKTIAIIAAAVDSIGLNWK